MPLVLQRAHSEPPAFQFRRPRRMSMPTPVSMLSRVEAAEIQHILRHKAKRNVPTYTLYPP